MDATETTFRRGDLVIALAGAAAAGAAVGLPRGLAPALDGAATLCGTIFAVAGLMLPALYVTLAVTDSAPAPASLAACSACALRSTGAVLLGCAPALLFLGATGPGHAAVPEALATVALAGIVGLRILRRRLDDAITTLPARLAFFVWALVAAALGARFAFNLV